MIHLQCKAGGLYSGGQAQHLEGNILEFSYFLKSDEGNFSIKRWCVKKLFC